MDSEEEGEEEETHVTGGPWTLRRRGRRGHRLQEDYGLWRRRRRRHTLQEDHGL